MILMQKRWQNTFAPVRLRVTVVAMAERWQRVRETETGEEGAPTVVIRGLQEQAGRERETRSIDAIAIEIDGHVPQCPAIRRRILEPLPVLDSGGIDRRLGPPCRLSL